MPTTTPLLPHQIVTAILDELQGRGGFDHWWDDIDEEIQEEITNSLILTVQAVMPESAGLRSV